MRGYSNEGTLRWGDTPMRGHSNEGTPQDRVYCIEGVLSKCSLKTGFTVYIYFIVKISR